MAAETEGRWQEEAQVMTSAEKRDFQGVTIDADTGEAVEGGQQADYQERPRYYRVHSEPAFGSARAERFISWLDVLVGNSWKGRLLRLAGLTGLVLLAVFFISFVLPALLMVAGVFAALWLIRYFLR